LKAADRSVIDSVHATRHKEPWLPHWRWQTDGPVDRASLGERLARLERRRLASERSKGEPDRHAATQVLVEDISAALARDDGRRAIATALLLAASDVLNEDAFGLYVDLVKHFNAESLSAARRVLARNVVMHVSCEARLQRAEASCASFSPALSETTSQLIVVGDEGAATYRYDAARNVLHVPTSDAYEHLPAKVISALSFLSLCGGVEAVLKVDDDHRLKSADALRRRFASIGGGRPNLYGVISELDALGTYNRTWHYGKCTDEALNAQPHSFPMTTRWINGALGYLMNEAALRLMLWSGTYFSSYIAVSLYEDMTISDLVERQGGRLQDVAMAKALATVDEY
jgi:hypothetical protein